AYPMNALHEERQLSTEQRRALKFLADAGRDGCTGAMLLSHGFSIGRLDDLVWHGLATAHREVVKMGGRKANRPRIHVTESGRRALEVWWRPPGPHLGQTPTKVLSLLPRPRGAYLTANENQAFPGRVRRPRPAGHGFKTARSDQERAALAGVGLLRETQME